MVAFKRKHCACFVAEATKPEPNSTLSSPWFPFSKMGNKELTVFHVTCREHIFLVIFKNFSKSKIAIDSQFFPTPVLVCDFINVAEGGRPSGSWRVRGQNLALHIL